eukprot:15366183-Ditylum_brightwellii.AAC.2
METSDKLIGTKITKNQWKDKVIKWHESTTTSPSGRHVGNFKALICWFEEFLDTKEGREMYRKREDIIDTHVGLLNYAVEKRYSYKWWQIIVNIAIAKLLGIDKINLIQILYLYEADYLLFIGLIWKELVEDAEKRGTINQGIHGGCQASCYDRILPNISSLVTRKKCMHKIVTFVHTTTLENANYCLKTALGVSEGYYSHCKTFPICSSGQGTTNSPQIWLVISLTICSIYEESAHGAEFISPDQDVSILLAVLGLVDDVNNQVNKFHQNDVTVQQLLENMQQDSQFKEDGLPQSMAQAPDILL